MTSHIDPELEAAYDTARTTPAGSGPYVARFAEASAAARLACPHRTVRYGDRPAEAIDLFRAAAGSPLLVFIHGGYWRRMTRADFSFVAPPLARAGVSVAIVGYPLAPEVDLDTIVAAVCRGTEVAVAAAAGDGMDVARLTLAGHSVGAQLAAMVAVRLDVRALVGLSGLYDLAPLRATSINAAIAMTPEAAVRNAPLEHPPVRARTFVAAVGGRESGAFHEQTARYARAWERWGGSVIPVDAPEEDHFSLVLALADPERSLTRTVARVARGD